MNVQTGSIEITGLSAEILSNIEERARAAGTTAEDYLRTWIEQEYQPLMFSAEQLAEFRQAAQRGLDQIAQGQARTYRTADALFDEIEASLADHSSQK